MNKKLLLLTGILLGSSNITLAHAVAQKIESILEPTSIILNDPTMPKVAINLEPINILNNIKNSNKDASQEQSAINRDKLKLSVITIKNDDKSAVINDKILREKDEILGYKIIKIEYNKVTLKNPKHNDYKTKSKVNFATEKELEERSGFLKKPGSVEQPDSVEESDFFTELKLPSITIKTLSQEDLSITDQFNLTPNNKSSEQTTTGNDNVYN